MDIEVNKRMSSFEHRRVDFNFESINENMKIKF